MRLRHDMQAPRTAKDASVFGRVAVLFGGDSAEREVSLLSGRAVLAALRRRNVDARPFDPRDQTLTALLDERIDRAWIALHGPGGEDGTLQGALECLGVPYTGSGVMGSAIAMDKLRTKRLAHAVGVATPGHVVLRDADDFEFACERLGLPLIVKPVTQGSSLGISKVLRLEELPTAFDRAAEIDSGVFAEQWVEGEEYSVAMLKGAALPVIRIETPGVWYDYEAKYVRDDTRLVSPCGLSRAAEQHLASLALAAFEAVEATGWGRADFMVDATGRPLLLEVNTVPGMTENGLVSLAARAAGLDFDELAWQVLETSLSRERH